MGTWEKSWKVRKDIHKSIDHYLQTFHIHHILNMQYPGLNQHILRFSLSTKQLTTMMVKQRWETNAHITLDLTIDISHILLIVWPVKKSGRALNYPREKALNAYILR